MTWDPEHYHDLCNDYANQVEDEYVTGLFIKMKIAESKAEKCSCHQCKKGASCIDETIAKEIDRIAPMHPLNKRDIEGN